MATTTPENTDKPKDIPDILSQAEQSLHAWKAVAADETEKAEDLRYYAEELWCEDKHKWATGKRKVLRKEWTVEQFDKEMNALHDKQEPVWNELINRAADIRARLELPYEKVKESHEAIKQSLKDPLAKFLQPFVKLFASKDTPEQAELRHEYHEKWRREFEEAEEAFQALCGYPEGLLTKVRLFRSHADEENSHLLEAVHKKKGLSHDEAVAPEVAPAVEQ